eukprot:NODE_9019_length_1452_cov_7.010566.p2 GENE.NODE_9019_length_1452_cov_7.010566~~NODE_9019_length_1452_cov_7.010566.p2  ORF type:complete len:261 (-),score=95.41 NODE_9019_length_1452_cov_7.010566:669-1451(-)
MGRDAAAMREWLNNLQIGLDKNFAADHSDRGVWEEAAKKLQRGFDSLTKHVEDLKNAHNKQTDMNRQSTSDFDNMLCNLQNLDERVKKASALLKNMNTQLADTNERSTRCEEDQERVKASLGETRGTTQALSTLAAAIQEELRRLAKEMLLAQQKLESAQNALRQQNGKLQGTDTDVKRLADDGRNASQMIRGLQQQLAETARVAQAAKCGLAETNSLVLPNIAMDSRGLVDLEGSMGGGRTRHPSSTRHRQGGAQACPC